MTQRMEEEGPGAGRVSRLAQPSVRMMCRVGEKESDDAFLKMGWKEVPPPPLGTKVGGWRSSSLQMW
jgi:hypothetical protein